MKSTEYIDTPLAKPSRLSIRQQVKKDKEKNINSMGTFSILWFLYKRHETELLYTAIVLGLGLEFFHKIGVL